MRQGTMQVAGSLLMRIPSAGNTFPRNFLIRKIKKFLRSKLFTVHYLFINKLLKVSRMKKSISNCTQKEILLIQYAFVLIKQVFVFSLISLMN